MLPERPSDPPVLTRVVGGVRVAYTDEGQGRTVVAIHGLPGSVRDFRWLAPVVSRSARFLRLDLPGYGDSERDGPGARSTEALAAAVVQWMDDLGVRDAVVVGHSSGGAVAARVARSRPELVRAVALLATPGSRPHYARWPMRVASRLLSHGWGRALLMPLQRRAYRAMGFPSQLTDAALTHTTHDASVLDFDAHAATVASLSCVVLVAWAEDDALIPASTSMALAAMAPDGPRLHWPNGGHAIQKTHAVELGAAILALGER